MNRRKITANVRRVIFSLITLYTLVFVVLTQKIEKNINATKPLGGEGRRVKH